MSISQSKAGAGACAGGLFWLAVCADTHAAVLAPPANGTTGHPANEVTQSKRLDMPLLLSLAEQHEGRKEWLVVAAAGFRIWLKLRVSIWSWARFPPL
jgi:hypothetical protein